jgi:hypothetical protein
VHEVVTGLDPAERARAADGHPLFPGMPLQPPAVTSVPA